MNSQFPHEKPHPQNPNPDISDHDWTPAMLVGSASGMAGGVIDVLLNAPIDGRLAAAGCAMAGIAITRLLQNN